MVSPAKLRASGFASLQEISDGRYDSNATRSRGRSDAKYEATEDPRKRLRRLTSYVKQALEPFYRGADSLRAGVPAADTIRRFLERTATSERAAGPRVVELNDFRKCLFALGVTPEDSAFLLESLDRKRTGVMDSKVFAATFLPTRHTGGATGMRRRLPGYGGSEENNEPPPRRREPAPRTAVEAFHQRVVERVLVKYANVKDAFRQYDTSRSGVLSPAQFRGFLRDLGFVGADVDALVRHLDRGNQHAISFNAFAQGLATDQSYAKSSPKRKLVEPLQSRPGDAVDSIERVRAKLRQRVLGRDKSIREVFLEFDADGNGHLDHGEFKRFMAAYAFSPDETRLTIAFLDKDFSGTIDYDEFASGLLFYRPNAAATEQPPLTDDERQAKHGAYLLEVVREKLAAGTTSGDLRSLRDEFERFDADGSGALDYHEFSAFLVGLGVKLSPRDLAALMLVVDGDGSKQIEFHEFASVFGSRGAVATRQERAPRESEPSDPLDAVFSRYDVDHSGQLDYAEFSQLMRDHGFAEGDIVRVVKQLDRSNPHGDGVDLDTFKTVVQSREWKLSQQATAASTAKAVSIHEKKKNKATALAESLLVSRILRDHQSLADAFRQHDLDGSGELEHDEFRRFMKHYGMRDDAQIDRLVAALDSDDSGTVSLDDFMAHFQLKPTRSLATTAKPKAAKPDKLRELKQVWVDEVLDHHESLASAFRDHDRTGRGELDYEAFRDLMGQYGVSHDGNVRLLLTQVDSDGSGTVSLDEFLAVFGPLAKSAPTKPPKRQAAAKGKPPPALAAGQATANAVRLHLLEEEWVRKALSAHGSVRQAFDRFDADGSGHLDHDEFRELLAAFGITREDDVATMIKRLDVDRSGAIDYDEFATLFHESRVRAPPPRAAPAQATAESKASGAARLRELEVKWIKRVLSCHPTVAAAFAEYDRDGNGALDLDEFAHLMKRYGIVQDDDIARLVRRLDLDGSGTIDLNEFSTVFNALRCGAVGAGVRIGEDEELDAEELVSVLEIERELAERILTHTRDLRAAFQKFDLNGNGKLEYKEFRTVLKAYKFPEPEIRKVIRHLDKDVSGFIDYREFISAFAAVTDGAAGGKRGSVRATATRKTKRASRSPQKHTDNARATTAALVKSLLEQIVRAYGTVQSAFRKYDAARNGSLEPEQFETMLADLGFPRADAERLLREFDADQSGRIEYEEFLTRLIREEGR